MSCRLALALSLAAVAALPVAVQAQERTITGRVYDAATQQGVNGAQIAVVGDRRGTQATEDGRFRLTVPAGEVPLTIRAIGYRRVDMRVPAGQTEITVAMQREALRLTEVVVTGAATTQERRNVSTAVSTVTADEVSRVPASSFDNALQGKIVGANINMNSGAPGGGGQIQIRGVTSILGNGEPLYVIDGVIISNAAFSTGINAVSRASTAASAITTNQDNAVNRLADLNPNDIESVQVLKSAAATAIYGSKATNGVVLITTKRGRLGDPRFTLTQRLGQYTATRLLGSRRFTQATLTEILGATDAQKYCPGTAATACPYYDYQGDLFGQRDLSYETVATMSGGSDQTKYFVSAFNKNDRGTQLNSGARRQSVRTNFDQSWGEQWTVNASASISRSLTDRGLSNNDNTYLSPMYAFGYTPAVMDLMARVGGRRVDNAVLESIAGTGTNPFQTVDALRNREDVWRQLANATVRFNALSRGAHTIYFSGQAGIDRYDAEGQVYSPNFLQFEADDGLPGTSVQSEALSRQYNGSISGVHEWRPSASIFGFLTAATTSAGIQMEDRQINRFNVQARGLVPTIDLIDQGQPTLFQVRQIVRDQALFVNEEILALDEKLSLSGRVRAERSSVNGDREQYFYWPAASASYRFTTPLPYTDEIKVRGAWGRSGNQALYGQRDVVIAGLGLIDARTALGAPASIGNPNIRPEEMTEVEFGVDALFADRRVGLEASYYDRKITNMLLQAPLAPSSGHGQRFINGGELRTDGIELALNLVPVRTQNVQWNSRAQYYTYDSFVESLPVADFVVGSSGFGAAYGRSRIAKGQKATLIWGNRKRADGTVVDTALADANPDFQMQFSNDVTFRNWSVTALVDWRKGGYVSNMTQNLFDEGGNSWDYDQPSGQKRADGTDMPLGEYRYSNWDRGRNAMQYIQDGSYVKLREITLSYTVPQAIAQRVARSRDVRLSVSGRNLATWSDYWSPDPEVNNFGNQNVTRFVDLAPYPPSRSFFLSIDLGF